MKHLYLTLTLWVLASPVWAQTDSVSFWVKEGMRLYNQGAAQKALVPLGKAQKVDPGHTLLNYELALCHFSLGDYAQALTYSEQVLRQKEEYLKEAYLVKGSALDNLGKGSEAKEVYRTALRAYPEDYLLYYNLGLTCYNSGDLDCAESSIASALTYNPQHASSHLLLGYLMNDRARRVPSVLALYYFLSLEPNTKRSQQALALLREELEHGVAKTTTRRITLNLPEASNRDEFTEADLMLSMLAASGNLEENKGKSPAQLFAENSQAFFQLLADKYPSGGKTAWASMYLSFFSELAGSGYAEAFCYWISQRQGDGEVGRWLSENKAQLDKLQSWMEAKHR